MGNAWHNGLFTADFQVNTLVQVFFVIQCIWTGCMGTLVTIDPNFSPINEIGIFVRKPGTKKSEKGSRFLLSTLCAGWVRKKDESDEVAAIDPKEGTNLDDASNLDEASATDHKEGKNPVLIHVQSIYFTADNAEEEVVHPNVRGSWNVRGGSMTIVAAGALFMGTREVPHYTCTQVVHPPY